MSSRTNPSTLYVAVTPSDTVNFPLGVARSLYVGVGGTVQAVPVSGGPAVQFSNVPSGATLLIEALRVNATGTTASGIVALY